MRQILVMALIVLVALPASFILTILTFPFWAWFEDATGIEAMGHSGPADWCFLVVWGLCAGVGLIFHWCRRR